ncbi:MAG: hypothetical protein AAB802_04595, partial [Patescibacteria group bacterium]
RAGKNEHAFGLYTKGGVRVLRLRNKLLVDKLNAEGHAAVYVKYPVYDMEPTGPALNQFLRGGEAQNISEEELQMWFALNRFQFEPTLKGWLAEGKIVVAEDYTGTGIAWGTVKGAKTDWLESLNAPLLKEDLAILMDGQRQHEAAEEGHLHESNEAVMNRSRDVHLDLGKKYGWKRIELQDKKEDTAALIWELVNLHLQAGS